MPAWISFGRRKVIDRAWGSRFAAGAASAGAAAGFGFDFAGIELIRVLVGV
jgi:hypothetical protein